MTRCRWLEGEQCGHPRLLEIHDQRIVVAQELQSPEGGWWITNVREEKEKGYIADCQAVAELGEEHMDEAACWISPLSSKTQHSPEYQAYLEEEQASLPQGSNFPDFERADCGKSRKVLTYPTSDGYTIGFQGEVES